MEETVAVIRTVLMIAYAGFAAWYVWKRQTVRSCLLSSGGFMLSSFAVFWLAGVLAAILYKLIIAAIALAIFKGLASD